MSYIPFEDFFQSEAESSRLARVGDPNSKETDKYDVGNMSYPTDLLNNKQYGDNYAIFYINVQSESKLIKNQGAATVDGAQLGLGSVLSNSGITQAGAIGTTIAAGLGLGGIVGAFSGGAKTAAVAGGLAAGASTAQIAASQEVNLKAEVSKPLKRLKTAIALHMPNQLNTRYGAQYDEDNTAAFQMIAEGSASLVEAAKAAKTSAASGIDKLKEDLIPIVAAASANATPDALQRLTRSAPNPKKEQIFRGVDFRTFTFQYEFFPRSQQEANNVLNIIKTFKYHMHPEFIDPKQFLYSYPSEFDIKFYKGGSENTRINRIGSCVLQDISVNYTPNGIYNTFADGTPTQINVQMTFKELAVLSKETIDQGY